MCNTYKYKQLPGQRNDKIRIQWFAAQNQLTRCVQASLRLCIVSCQTKAEKMRMTIANNSNNHTPSQIQPSSSIDVCIIQIHVVYALSCFFPFDAFLCVCCFLLSPVLSFSFHSLHTIFRAPKIEQYKVH